jgi:hypothetical protein
MSDLENAMSITKRDFLDAMAGTASDETVAAVVAELQKKNAPLSMLLKGLQAWSGGKLPSVAQLSWPVQLPEEDSDGESTNEKRRRSTRGQRSQIVEDYLSYRAGKASREVIDRVRQALWDADSELSRNLRGIGKLQRVPRKYYVPKDHLYPKLGVPDKHR